MFETETVGLFFGQKLKRRGGGGGAEGGGCGIPATPPFPPSG